MNYKNIKKILQGQIDNNVKTLWTFNEKQKEFTMIYENYSNKLQIFTPEQLLRRIKTLQESKATLD